MSRRRSETEKTEKKTPPKKPRRKWKKRVVVVPVVVPRSAGHWFVVFESADQYGGQLSGARIVRAISDEDAAQSVMTPHMRGVCVAGLLARPVWFEAEAVLKPPVALRMPGEEE